MRSYLTSVWITGAMVLTWIFLSGSNLTTVPFSIFLLLAGLASIAPVPLRKSTVSVAWAVGYASALLWGAEAAGIAGLVMALTMSLYPRRFSTGKILFNVAVNVSVSWIMGLSVEMSSQLPLVPGFLFRYIVPPTAHYIGVSFLTAVAIGLSSMTSPAGVWRQNFAPLSLHYLLLAPIGVALAMAYETAGIVGLAALAVPLFLVRYSMKLYTDKARESEEYVRCLEEAQTRNRFQLQELVALSKTAVAINYSLDLKETLKLLLDTCQDVTSGSWCEVRVLDESQQVVTMLRRGQIDASVRDQVEERMDDVLRTLEPIVVSPSDAEQVWMVPLRARDQTVGVLSASCRGHRLETADLVWRTLGAHAAVAIANAHLHEQTQVLSKTDDMTGVYRHRHFLTLLQQHLADPTSWRSHLAMVDIDKLRMFNTAFGHHVGDEVVQFVAHHLTSSLGPRDLAARYAGDKFLVLFQARTGEELQAWVENLQNAGRTFRHSATALPVILHIGSAVREPGDQQSSAWIARAEAAMRRVRAEASEQIEGLVGADHTSARRAREARKRMDRTQFTDATEIVRAMVSVAEAKDPHTHGHSVRVQQYASDLARFVGLPTAEVESIALAALLHDIGKIGVPDHVLNKPGPLTEKEFSMVKQHPQIAVEILQRTRVLKHTLPVVAAHHERVDGRGYPLGLKGPAIPLGARILAVADTYEALTAARVYRSGYSKDRAVAEMLAHAGTQLDAFLVAAFIKMLELRGLNKITDSA